MASAQSTALRSTPGYVARPSTTAFKPPTYTPPALPAMPDLPSGGNAPNSTERAWLGAQLGQLPGQLNANLTNIRAGAQQALAGYGGYKFREDDPNTPEREDMILDFDAGAGLGEREKMAVRGEQSAANSRGLLYSSFANQNIGQAVQRLSLEAQQVANQYAQAVNGAQTDYANQVASITGQMVSLYGQDAAYLIDNPPPTPDPTANLPTTGDGTPLVWRGSSYPDLNELRARYPGYPLGVRKAGDGSFVVVIGEGAAKPPAPASKVTYKDFLKGRTSTAALAAQWRKKYGGGA